MTDCPFAHSLFLVRLHEESVPDADSIVENQPNQQVPPDEFVNAALPPEIQTNKNGFECWGKSEPPPCNLILDGGPNLGLPRFSRDTFFLMSVTFDV
jgi:hypothetical protein